MIPKSGNRFSVKIMLQQKVRAGRTAVLDTPHDRRLDPIKKSAGEGS
jgi:hypothetical protein